MRRLILLLIFIVSCAKPPEVKPAYTSADYLRDGNAALAGPGDAKLTYILNSHAGEFASERKQLLDQVIKRESADFGRAKEARNFDKMLFHLENLTALGKYTPQQISEFSKKIPPALNTEGRFSEAKALAMKIDSNLAASPDFYAPGRSFDFYRSLLVEIHVDNFRTARSGILRHDLSFGSGFFVSSRQILTAWHVVSQVKDLSTALQKLTVRTADKDFTNVRVAAWDSLSDLALLELDSDAGPVLDVPIEKLFGNSENVKEGFPVYTYGSPEGWTATITKGIVSSPKRRAPEVGQWLQVDAPTAPGASGGLLLGGDGLIYGLIDAGYIYNDINFAVPSQIILQVLPRLRSRTNAAWSWLGILLEQDGHDKVRVVDFFPSSPFANTGIPRDSILQKLNGRSIRRVEEAQDLCTSLINASWVALELLPPGKTEPILRWGLTARRPDNPIYNATMEDGNRLATLYAHFGFEVEQESIIREVSAQGKKISLKMYKVKEVRPSSPLYSEGVVAGDYIGFLSDYDDDLVRVIQVVHQPADTKVKWIEHFDDFIYKYVKSGSDDNIL